jgi:hypothetical protein
MFRIITFSIRRLEKDGTTVDEELSYLPRPAGCAW